MQGLSQRVFLAIDPKPWKDVLSHWQISLQQKLDNQKLTCVWSKKDSLHVTLLFLGELQHQDVSYLQSGLQQFSMGEKIQLNIREIGVLNKHHIVAFLENDNLANLHDALHQYVNDLGIRIKKEHQFMPHITLGKIKDSTITQTVIDGFNLIDIQQCQMLTIQHIALYQSFTGNHYEILKQYAL